LHFFFDLRRLFIVNLQTRCIFTQPGQIRHEPRHISQSLRDISAFERLIAVVDFGISLFEQRAPEDVGLPGVGEIELDVLLADHAGQPRVRHNVPPLEVFEKSGIKKNREPENVDSPLGEGVEDGHVAAPEQPEQDGLGLLVVLEVLELVLRELAADVFVLRGDERHGAWGLKRKAY
jgi:hypothetical protein